MLNYPHIDPVALSLGPIQVHWYGIMYLLGFSGAWALGRYRAARSDSGWNVHMVDDGIFYGVLGTILGGRLGYIFFYGFEQLTADPWVALRVWEGGMSFHGGLIGVTVAMWLFGRHHGLGLLRTMDFAAPLIPPGLFAGRIGNFINGELWGHPTTVPWGMRIPCERFGAYCGELAPGARWSPPLHASQLYEAALEGLVLFLILWIFSAKPRPTMAVAGLFLLGYGVFRFGVEFVRLPDAHIGYLTFDWLTMGHLLTLPMVMLGAVMLVLAYRGVARP